MFDNEKALAETKDWTGQQKLRRDGDVGSVFLAERIVTRTDFSINLWNI